MRILHTSDWHLGRSFGPVSLHADQQAFLDWLVELVVVERVDLVVVAGDLYDRAIPPTDSVALLRDTLERLVAHRVRVVAIAGNHDGPDRVAAYDGLTDLAGVVVRGGFGRAGALTTLELDDGPLDVVAVPYLDPVLVPPAWAELTAAAVPAKAAPAPAPPPLAVPAVGDEPTNLFDFLEASTAPEPAPAPAPATGGAPLRTHHAVLAEALRRAAAEQRSPRRLAVAHAFVSGALPSDSERLLTVGGTAEVGVELFDGFHYVALGHLHRPQRVTAGVDHVRYSGTPLPYSFSETHPKQVVLVDMAPDGTTEVCTVEVPVGRGVATVTGTLDELLADPTHRGAVDRFVRAVLTDPGYVVDAKSRLQARFPHVVEVVLAPVRPDTSAPQGAGAGAVRRMAPLEAAVGFWLDVTGDEPTEVERSLLESALAHVASAEARA
jgi:DNA repair protein SbcD/Mre11